MSTPMKIPRTTNEKYAIIRAEEEEQRKRKTSVKREAAVLPVCRRVVLTPDVAIQTIQIPCADSSVHTPTPLPGSDSTPSATTPHAIPFESQPNSPW